MYLEILSSSTLLIGYYHGLLLRDTSADSLIGHLCYYGLLPTHEQNVILSGHSLHCRNWLLLEHVRHMDSSSLMIFSKLVKDLWPQIGIQLVTGMLCTYVPLHIRMHACLYVLVMCVRMPVCTSDVCMYACMY